MSELIKEGSLSAKIVQEEETLHLQVQERVMEGGKKKVDVLAPSDLDRDLIELRDAIAEAKPEDLAPLVEQMTRLAALRGRLGKGKDLPVDVQSPYFAHMVLQEGPKDKRKTRDVLIGKRGFIDRGNNVQIVDWRNAPISQVYYRYDEGDDYDEEVGDLVLSGEVLLKRNVSIQRGTLRRIGTPQGTYVRNRDGIWHEASGSAAPTLQGGSGTASRPKAPTVSRHKKNGEQEDELHQQAARLGVHGGEEQNADKHLPEIAALIDKEQFELITQPKSGMIVIQGGAGSGKTTVALHRIAFLNFADKQRFRANKILFVVPSKALERYVEAVLPSLGVRGVPVITYFDWARSTRLKVLRGTRGKYNYDTPDNVTRVKKHAALLPMLEDFAREKVAEAEEELGELTQGADLVLAEWHALSKMALVPRLRNLYRWLKRSQLSSEARIAAESRIKSLGRRSDDIIEDWAEVMTDFDRLWKYLEPAGVSRSAVEATVRWCLGQELEGVEQDEAEKDEEEIRDVEGRSLDEDSRAGLYDFEDDPLLLRLVQLKRGAIVAKDVSAISYSHVAIDEAQDRSAIEVKVLLEATETESEFSKNKSVTIAGDTAQRLVFDNGFTGWEELLRQTGNSSVMVRPLKLSYRSTAEVMALALEILGPTLAPADPLVARSGAPVELHQFGDVGEAVAFLADALRGLVSREPGASIALLTRYPEQADLYYGGLRRAEVPNLRRVQRDEFCFRAGIDVTDASQVKGLEFDYVIMVDVNTSTYPETDECRHLMHIAATRAAYQLWLVSTSEPSRLLPASLREF